MSLTNASFDYVQSRNRETKLIFGTFSPNGSSNPVATSNIGRGWTVAWIATGLWTVTLESGGMPFGTILHGLRLASLPAVPFTLYIPATSIDVTTGNLTAFRLQYVTGAVPVATDIAAATNNKIDFCVLGINTKQPRILTMPYDKNSSEKRSGLGILALAMKPSKDNNDKSDDDISSDEVEAASMLLDKLGADKPDPREVGLALKEFIYLCMEEREEAE